MKTLLMHILGGLVLAIGSLHASTLVCIPSCNIGTGQTGAGGVLGTASDPYWSIISAPSGNNNNTSGPAVLVNNPIWSLSIGSGIDWIATNPVTSNSSNYPGGAYVFELTLPGPGLLSVSVAADNAVNVYLDPGSTPNGTSACATVAAGTPGCQLTWGDFGNNDASGFSSFSNTVVANITTPGTHTLYLDVENGAGSYMGVVLRGSFSSAPEPGTWAMLSCGLILTGLGLLVKRSNWNSALPRHRCQQAMMGWRQRNA